MPRGQFWVYFASSVFFNFGLSVFFFLFNVHLLGAGFNERSLGLFGSFAAAGGLLGTLAAGLLAQRFGLRFTLISGMTVAIAACAVRACVPVQIVQIVAAAIGGLGLSSLAVCLSPLVAALSIEKNRATAFSLIFASGIGDAGFGSLAAGWLPGWVQRHAHRTQTAFTSQRDVLLLGCFIASLGLLVLARLRVPVSCVPDHRWNPRPGPFLRRFLPFIALWGVVTSALPPFANVFFVHHLGFSLERMGSILSMAQAIQLAAILLYPLLASRMGVLRSMLLTQVLTAALLGGLACSTFPATTVWLYWGYTASQYANEPGLYSFLMQGVPERERSTVSASVFFVQAISQIVASYAMGFFITSLGYRLVLLILAGVAGVAALYLKRTGAPERRASLAPFGGPGRQELT